MLFATSADEGIKRVVGIGEVIDDFERDDGWVGDRAATCLNRWVNDGDPAYIKNGAYQCIPLSTDADGAFNDYTWSYIYIGPGNQEIYLDVVNGDNTADDQTYWIVQLGMTADAAGKHVQFEICQRNSFVVWYYPGATFPTIYASGAGYVYGSTKRYYFKKTNAGSYCTFSVRVSDLDGSNMTTIMTGTTGSDNPDGSYMAIAARRGNQKFLQIVRTGPRLFDDFNRADSTLVNMPDGTAYVISSSGAHPPKVASNQLVCTGASSSESSTVLVNSGSTTHTIEYNISAMPYSDGVKYISTYLRNTSGSDTLFVQFSNAGATWFGGIYKIVGGVQSTLVNAGSSTASSVLPIYVIASITSTGAISATIYFSNNTSHTVTVTDNTRTGTRTGFEMLSTSTYDNLSIN